MKNGRISLAPAEKVSLLTVYDNYLAVPDLRNGWGFSCVIRVDRKTILFDTGADGAILLDNMRKLEISPNEIEYVVLSHDHGDHTGGLSGFLDQNPKVTVFVPEVFPNTLNDLISASGAKPVKIKSPQKITDSVAATGQIEGGFPEQALLVNTIRGLVLITGCAHPGIIRTIEIAKKITGCSIHLALGGFHLGLGGYDERALKGVIADMRKLGIEKAAPCHCSSDLARIMFKETFGENHIDNGVGKIITL